MRQVFRAIVARRGDGEPKQTMFYRFVLCFSLPFAAILFILMFTLVFMMLVGGLLLAATGVVSAIAGAGRILGMMEVISDLSASALFFAGVASICGGFALILTAPLFARRFVFAVHRYLSLFHDDS